MIYIIIPVFNNLPLTKKCIASLERQTIKDKQIIIVDDGSTDGTSEYLKMHHPDIIIVHGTGNWWWALSMNKGLEVALKKGSNHDFILSLNNDLEVKNDYIENMLICCRNNSPCVVGSVSVYDNNHEKIEFAGAKWNRFTGKRKELYKKTHTFSQLIGMLPIETDLLPGRGTLFPIEVFKKIGMYDHKSFPQYIADQELSIRAAKNGFPLLVEPSAVVFSNVGNTGIYFNKGTKKSFKNIYRAFFSIKSPTYLPGRFKFALKHSPLGILYFFIDFARVAAYIIRN